MSDRFPSAALAQELRAPFQVCLWYRDPARVELGGQVCRQLVQQQAVPCACSHDPEPNLSSPGGFFRSNNKGAAVPASFNSPVPQEELYKCAPGMWGSSPPFQPGGCMSCLLPARIHPFVLLTRLTLPSSPSTRHRLPEDRPPMQHCKLTSSLAGSTCSSDICTFLPRCA